MHDACGLPRSPGLAKTKVDDRDRRRGWDEGKARRRVAGGKNNRCTGSQAVDNDTRRSSPGQLTQVIAGIEQQYCPRRHRIDDASRLEQITINHTPAGPENLPAVAAKQSGRAKEQRRLPRAPRTRHHEDLARSNLDRCRPERGDAHGARANAGDESLRDAVELERGLESGPGGHGATIALSPRRNVTTSSRGVAKRRS
jgi:hypothetical protein